MRPPQGDIFFKTDGSGKKAPFAEVFPEIESLEAVITESGPGNQGLGVRRLRRTSYREFINCSNVQCSGHGLLTGNILREMARQQQSHVHSTLRCAGREESGAPCQNQFEIHLVVSYKKPL